MNKWIVMAIIIISSSMPWTVRSIFLWVCCSLTLFSSCCGVSIFRVSRIARDIGKSTTKTRNSHATWRNIRAGIIPV
ncbi:uncharacterized protein BDW70DRAFT_131524, partial [Aspergillus foveolatus]|uniref:uncharacterized protein n=1 Tax=Aspergillus foveolatus TaxID=210207 RepID=UPI003CCE1930